MTIAFYKVDNSLNYGRHEFDNDTPEAIMEKLNKLPDDEVKVYDAGHYGWSSKELTLADFEQTYNDEELDRFRGRRGGEYSTEECEEFREVLYTMRNDEVAGWVRSLQLRGVELPEEMRDEVLLIVGERRQ